MSVQLVRQPPAFQIILFDRSITVPRYSALVYNGIEIRHAEWPQYLLTVVGQGREIHQSVDLQDCYCKRQGAH